MSITTMPAVHTVQRDGHNLVATISDDGCILELDDGFVVLWTRAFIGSSEFRQAQQLFVAFQRIANLDAFIAGDLDVVLMVSNL